MWESRNFKKRHNLLENFHISLLNNQDLLTKSLYLCFQKKIMIYHNKLQFLGYSETS